MQKHRKTIRLQNKASNKQLQVIAKRNRRNKMLLGLLNFNRMNVIQSRIAIVIRLSNRNQYYDNF